MGSEEDKLDLFLDELEEVGSPVRATVIPQLKITPEVALHRLSGLTGSNEYQERLAAYRETMSAEDFLDLTQRITKAQIMVGRNWYPESQYVNDDGEVAYRDTRYLELQGLSEVESVDGEPFTLASDYVTQPTNIFQNPLDVESMVQNLRAQGLKDAREDAEYQRKTGIRISQYESFFNPEGFIGRTLEHITKRLQKFGDEVQDKLEPILEDVPRESLKRRTFSQRYTIAKELMKSVFYGGETSSSLETSSQDVEFLRELRETVAAKEAPAPGAEGVSPVDEIPKYDSDEALDLLISLGSPYSAPALEDLNTAPIGEPESSRDIGLEALCNLKSPYAMQPQGPGVNNRAEFERALKEERERARREYEESNSRNKMTFLDKFAAVLVAGLVPCLATIHYTKPKTGLFPKGMQTPVATAPATPTAIPSSQPQVAPAPEPTRLPTPVPTKLAEPTPEPPRVEEPQPQLDYRPPALPRLQVPRQLSIYTPVPSRSVSPIRRTRLEQIVGTVREGAHFGDPRQTSVYESHKNYGLRIPAKEGTTVVAPKRGIIQHLDDDLTLKFYVQRRDNANTELSKLRLGHSIVLNYGAHDEDHDKVVILGFMGGFSPSIKLGKKVSAKRRLGVVGSSTEGSLGDASPLRRYSQLGVFHALVGKSSKGFSPENIVAYLNPEIEMGVAIPGQETMAPLFRVTSKPSYALGSLTR